MATADKFRALTRQIETRSYYDILRVGPSADEGEVKAAFHKFALVCHPDRAPDEDPELMRAAAELFKRGVEAYRILADPDLRRRYDAELKKGRLRLDEAKGDSRPPPPATRSLEMVASTPEGKRRATKADRLLSIGHLDDARVALTSACQVEPYNEELAERLRMVWEALALEPL